MEEMKRRELSVPNIITGFRLLLIPVFVAVYFKGLYGWALACLVVSGLSDVADGYIARHYNMVTDLGKLMDPVADKLTQGAVIFCLAWRIPTLWALLGLMAVKELVMGIWGVVTLRRTGRMNSSKWYGKACTVVLYVSMAVLVLFPRLPSGAVYAIVGLCAAVMLLSLTLYSLWYIRLLRENAGKESRPVREQGPAGQQVSLVLSMLIIVLLLVCAALALVFWDEINLQNIVDFTPENLWLAALVFMGLFAAKSLTSVVYVKLLYVAAGVIFPLPAALAVCLAGTFVELAIPYLIGWGGGTETAKMVVDRWPKLARLTEVRTRSNVWFSFFCRAVGVLPADPVSIYCGACRMPFPSFLLGSTLGLLPTLLITAVIGAEVEEPGSPGFIIAAVLFFVVQIASAVGFVLWIKKHDAASAAGKETIDGEPAK